MPHAGPDWGTYAPVSTIYSIQDLGELAARLGSIVTFDRRGNVFFVDDFESGIECWYYSGSPGYTVLWSPAQHKSGGFSLELTPPVGANNYAYAYRFFPYPSKSRLGTEISFNLGGWIQELDFEVRVYDGVYWYQPYIRFFPETKTWQYHGDDGLYHDLSPTTGLIVGVMFHTFKLVYDLVTGKYARLIIDTTTFDMSALNMYKTDAPGELPSTSLLCRVIDSTTYLSKEWLDDLILTQNEP